MAVLQYVLADRLPVWALAASATSMPNGGWFDDVQMWFVQHWDEFIVWAFQRRKNTLPTLCSTLTPHVQSTVLTFDGMAV